MHVPRPKSTLNKTDATLISLLIATLTTDTQTARNEMNCLLYVVT